jgi:hypothetical protein
VVRGSRDHEWPIQISKLVTCATAMTFFGLDTSVPNTTRGKNPTRKLLRKKWKTGEP